MIALLRESSNYNASIGTVEYVYGEYSMPTSDICNWLTVSCGSTSNVRNVLNGGGIPATINSGTSTMDRVWVSAVINGSSYVFDPALKVYDRGSRIDLAQATGYDQAALLSDARIGATIGSQGNYLQNLNEGNIANKLNQYSTNLINTIRSQYPNKEVDEILVKKRIHQTTLTSYPTSPPYTVTQTYANWNDIPSGYTATLHIVHEGIDATLYIPELEGKRLTITYSGTKPQLRLDGTLIEEGHTTSTGYKYNLVMSIAHPYSSGVYDQSYTFKPVSGGYYAVVTDFGGTNDALIQKRQTLMSQYQSQGLADTTEEVRGETLNVMGLSWMRECLLSERLLSSIAGTVFVIHHRAGLMAQDAGYYIDIPLSLGSYISKSGNTASAYAHFKVAAMFGSAFEHAILEQLMGSSNPGLSTAKILQLNNSHGYKTYLANSSNFGNIKNQLVNQSACDIAKLQSEVNGGKIIVLPQNCSEGIGTWGGSGYIAKKFTSSSGEIDMIISGNYHGGYASTPGYVSAPVVSNIVSNQVAVSYTPVNIINNVTSLTTHTSFDPVDMAGGAFLHANTDLALGGGGTMGLAFTRSYNSSMNFEKKSLSYGWTHNYDLYLDEHSDGNPGLGTRQPVDAAALIASLYPAWDLMKDDSTDQLLKWMIASLSAKRAVDWLIDNAVTVHLGSKLMQFVKLPDGTYSPPNGVTTQLVKNADGTYSLKERFGTAIKFVNIGTTADPDFRASTLTDVDGNTLTFTYSGSYLSSVKDAFNRTLALQYDASNRIDKVTDSAGRFVTYGYTNDDLTSYIDPDGKAWGYAYIDSTNPHRMTSLTNPLGITTATNVYDTLGRVMTQTTPRQTGSATYNFYFSGYRNAEEDPDGRMLVYYYDAKGRSIATEDQLGNKNYSEYDGQFHVVKATDERNYAATFTYDGNQNLIRTTNALTQSIDLKYDPQFRLTDTIDPLLHGAQAAYDSEHHPILSKSGVQYDANLLPTDNGLSQTGSTYFANGLPQTAIDGRGSITLLTYDSYGNPYTAKVGAHPVVTTAYNSKGWLTSLTDQVNTTTTFDQYNNRGQLKLKTDPLGKTTSFTYDDAGRLSYVIDRNNHRTDLSYTQTGKVDTVTYQDLSTVHFTYNQHDDLTGMQDSVGSTTYVYDAAHRLVSQTDPHGFQIGYTYDEAGNLTELIYPGNKKVIYTYDELNRLETVTIDWLNPKPVATYYYDNAGRLDYLVNFNGTITDYAYDNANRLFALENKKSDTSGIATYYFTLDANGNRTQIVQNEPFAPMPLAQDVAYTYNTQKNRLLAVSGQQSAFSYDDEGQLSSGYSSAYTFDYEHRLIAISGQQSAFSYDGADNRLKAVRNGVETRYVYDASGNLLAEADSNNVITAYFIHGAGLMAMVTPANEVYTGCWS